uniref:Uncharacterized protein n=1 Tax=Molossus molossus TaxID=27622 RepID=A0A7J8GL66_MOLMO|nr:hypothetical protein HJG59_011445 [Molossus molossus]
MNSHAIKTWRDSPGRLAQRLERRPAVLRDPGSVPAKGMYLGYSLSLALVGRAGGSHSMCPFHIDVSLSLSLFLSPPPTLPEQKMEKCPRVRIKKNKTKKHGGIHSDFIHAQILFMLHFLFLS